MYSSLDQVWSQGKVADVVSSECARELYTLSKTWFIQQEHKALKLVLALIIISMAMLFIYVRGQVRGKVDRKLDGRVRWLKLDIALSDAGIPANVSGISTRLPWFHRIRRYCSLNRLERRRHQRRQNNVLHQPSIRKRLWRNFRIQVRILPLEWRIGKVMESQTLTLAPSSSNSLNLRPCGMQRVGFWR